MSLLSIDRLSIAFGADKLLDSASFQLDPGERVCLIGRNGVPTLECGNRNNW